MTKRTLQNNSKGSPNGRGHVEMTNEMTNEIPTYQDSISETTSCEGTIGDGDITTLRTSMKAHEHRSVSSDEETQPISAWGSMREKDNQSTSSDSSWGTAVYTDMRFAMLSNAVFFLGASIQTYTSFVDLKDAKKGALMDDDAWDDDRDDDDYVYTVADKVWYALYSIGPFLYLINSIIDIRWMTAQLVSPWYLSLWCRCFNRDDSPSSLEIQCPGQHGQLERIIEVNMDGMENDTENSSDFESNNSCSTMDSTVDSSEEIELIWHIVAACVFGLGAFFEFYSTFLDDVYQDIDDWDDDVYLIQEENKRKWYFSNYNMDFIGMHLYFLSGIIELIAQRNSYRRGIKMECFGDTWRYFFGSNEDHENDSDNESPVSSNPKDSSNRLAHFLMFLGTVLFLCGITIDCTIAYISDPKIRHELDSSKAVLYDLNQVTLSIFDVISSVLWNLDAILYICADILLYSLHKKGSKGRQWLCKKRISCTCDSDELDIDDEDSEDNTHDLYDTTIPSLPELGLENNVAKPLLGSSSRTSYSSL